MKTKSNFGLIFWIHLFFIIIAYASPFLLNWKIVLFGVILIYIQNFVFQGCLLTHAQFGKDPYITFYHKYLTLLGFRINKYKLKFFMAWIMPIIILLVAIIWQLILEISPLII